MILLKCQKISIGLFGPKYYVFNFTTESYRHSSKPPLSFLCVVLFTNQLAVNAHLNNLHEIIAKIPINYHSFILLIVLILIDGKNIIVGWL